MVIHVVKPGESIYSIAQQYGVSPSKIISDNELTNPNQLVVGQTLVILDEVRTHVVAPGESLYTISRRYRVSVQEILDANPQVTNPAQIFPGQVLTIPVQTRKYGTIEVNGYAFPNIDREVLRKTLPYLTYLSIFSYEVNSDGSLKQIEDEELIQAAREANVAPLMVITNISEEGGFSSDLASTILNDEEVQETLINNVIETLQNKNYYGLGIDFEFIYPRDREAYNNFLRKIVPRLNELGYIVTTALAPKTSADQPGLLYEAHDYPVHGELVDHVILMTYEWGYTYSPPRAVAPINEVRRVIDYAVTAIPREKIFMGIPNYGYDWTLPYTRGSAARTVTNTGAVDLARRVGAFIKYDETAQAPYFNYYDQNARQHEVWFEDARSIEAKLELVNEYNLGGVSYWTIMSYFPQNWLVLDSLFDIEKVI
ncbi:LysM peptidoglycan-binding domain-containing protein [Caldisalinibacter kiritimatiensis]|uniref:Spore cortex-lytic enzyme, N-acetylglucosaminidase SleL n=1 Tax=Caldisalinibacter kiritimatiensis TaxID=1304284 RepID=R1CNL0_9FIRM|nr:LysM peptidoglycan-binding domain-containing protein [Caldisalinibacter kiritimatiensis]EOD00291.1 Spore cortex-lytic enzyme, N-acetylglucosaminidase SleL [Caldisalinibacter kiritimatiensis]